MPPLHTHPTDAQPKPNPNLLSIFLKPIIMLLLTSLFFLFIGFAAFLLLNLFLLAGALHRLRFRPTPTLPLPSPSDAFLPREINKLPNFRVTKGSGPGPDSRCPVCLDGFRNGQWCRNLANCGHVFHRRCVDTWLLKVGTCPTCRTPVRSNPRPQDCIVDARREEGSSQFWNCSVNTNALTIL
ncbi:RING-H2 finger protein ATL56 [Cicer arietinum]|uniref:RING-H2 finger protein ATL56 n=1 Tax=Cicer arietinum TaxID=3827 RepID=A0A1S3EBU6_CICAR|nr:RING-H2 finger protein ATL56 [Cicer arietinum]XP_012573310.1 RING-H2 finger protein ATL56 [Cicer arietinum]XP_012573311.1 RING-H2 finger protein ATL56 [Cicer arietinum]XP_012573312.1 RING-H2 finger protein ATL56 [Cicer arietinum]XP_027192139.1 RING-H2 finger protein ATL56 [Cicer arietinum]